MRSSGISISERGKDMLGFGRFRHCFFGILNLNWSSLTLMPCPTFVTALLYSVTCELD